MAQNTATTGINFGAEAYTQIVYGISVKTLQQSDAPIYLKINGDTQDAPTTVLLDNSKNNFETKTPDYFMIHAGDVGDIGFPKNLEFSMTNRDGWVFDDLEMDILVFASSEDAKTAVKRRKDDNSRAGLTAWLAKTFNKKATIAETIKFPGRSGVDGNESTWDRLKLKSKEIRYPAAVAGTKIIRPKGTWHDSPLGTFSAISLVNAKTPITNTITSTVTTKLVTSSSSSHSDTDTYSQSVQYKYQSGSEGIAKNAVTIGLSFSEARNTASKVAEELDKTFAEMQTWSKTVPGPDIPKGHVCFVISEDIRRVRTPPKQVKVGEKMMTLEESVLFTRPSVSDPIKAHSPELRAMWDAYKAKYPDLMSSVEYDLHVR
ncbi:MULTISPECIES: hypothetical protein [unclassified Marinovum]